MKIVRQAAEYGLEKEGDAEEFAAKSDATAKLIELGAGLVDLQYEIDDTSDSARAQELGKRRDDMWAEIEDLMSILDYGDDWEENDFWNLVL